MLVAVAVLSAAACKKPETVAGDAAPPPADHLAKDEVPEGPDKAFALRLPMASTVAMRFRESVHVNSSLSPEQLSNFVRARVREGTVATGTTMTSFENVIVPTEPQRHITVQIRPARLHSGSRSEMLVKDVTPPPPPDPNASEAELRRKAGLTPDGKLLDPKHMQ